MTIEDWYDESIGDEEKYAYLQVHIALEDV
jgi:hypothetical protein